MTEHLEVERKFDVPPDFAVPGLSGMPGCARVSGPRAERLAASYFDTGDLRLARHGVTLRRRSGGADAGWHLKLPVARGTRREIRVRLGAEGAGEEPVPPRLAGLAAAYARGRALRQVAVVETDRRVFGLLDDGGETLAEVADDRVTAEVAGDLAAAGAAGDLMTAETAGGTAAEAAGGWVAAGTAHRPGPVRWREIEVELGSGPPELLAAIGERLRAAGARPSAAASKLSRLLGVHRTPPPQRYRTAGDVLVSYVAAQVTAILDYDPRVRLADDDAVHQMRVAVRRIRSVLRVYGRLLDRDRAGPLDAELRWLAACLGTVRDLEVLRGRFADRIDELGQQRPGWLGMMARQQSAAHARLIKALRDQRYVSLLDALERFVADPPLAGAAAGDAARTVRPLVARAWRRVGRRFAQVDRCASEDDRAAARHAARKAAKRARYAAEAARPVLGGPAKAIAATAERLQEVLGTYQDGIVAQRRLAQMSDGAGETFLLGMVAGVEHCAAERTLDDIAAVWAKASKPKYARRLKRL
ncbi:MAG TPA: CYTH and CHAD domain-containing protein [Streptosporangiaceae bacterium]|nr:CYTH and CHAD domain-containing protein [Streptosporangiaceae bacterium]